MPHLIAFDLDGTLVDSRQDLANSANLLLAECGAAPLAVDDVVGMVGEGAMMLVRRVLRAAGRDVDIRRALPRFLEIYDEHLADHTRLYPGIGDALDALTGQAALALLTNKPEHHTRRLLDALGIGGAFFAVIGGDGEFPRKPDPAGLQHLMARAGAAPHATVMVGDSFVDVATARQAGTRVCVARYGFGRLETGDTAGDALVAETPLDVLPLLRRFITAAG